MNSRGARAFGLVSGLAMVLASLPTSAADLFVAGPVEKIDRAKREAVILGQRVQLSGRQFLVLQAVAQHQNLAGYQVYAEVVGSDAPNGVILAKTVQSSNSPYVAGSSQIAVRNFVTRPVNSHGLLLIGALKVDVSNAQAFGRAGDLIEMAGIQPSVGGVALASVLRRAEVNNPVTGGIIGSGQDGIIGSGQNGIIGSGQNGIIGSGQNGIIGSGQDGIIGSGQNGIIGSGQDGIIGSGQDGIIGSGQNGIIGSGQNGIIGSGQNGIIGSGQNGIIGSGQNGIIGSGSI